MKKSILLSVFALAILAGCGNTTTTVNNNMSGTEETGMMMTGNTNTWTTMMMSGDTMTWTESGMLIDNNTASGDVMTGSTGMVKDKPEAYNFDIPNCDKYVKLMECVIDKIPAGKRTDTITQYEQVIKMRKGFSGADLKAICDQTIDSLKDTSGSFEQIGCSL